MNNKLSKQSLVVLLIAALLFVGSLIIVSTHSADAEPGTPARYGAPPTGAYYDYAVYKDPRFPERYNSAEEVENTFENMSAEGWRVVQFTNRWLIFERPASFYGQHPAPPPPAKLGTFTRTN